MTGPTAKKTISRRFLLASASALAGAAVLRPAFSAEPIKIGFGISLTGPNSPAGKMFLLAREVWKDEINQKGGIFGRPVEFVYYDDQSNPSLVPSVYSKLLDVDKVDLLLSGFAEQSLQAVGSIDDAKLADHMQKTRFKTVVGDVKFGPLGEWEKSRILFVQYRNVAGNDINQFRNPGKAVIVSPKELRSGEMIYPFAKART